MLSNVFIFGLLVATCIGALARPHIGVIGYYGFALLQPQWNWRWSLPPGFQFQKYIVVATLIGFLFAGLSGNRLTGKTRWAVLSLATFLGLAYVSAAGTIDQYSTDFYMGNMWKMVLMAVLAIVLLDSPGKILACLWVLALAQSYNAYQINLQYFQDGFSAYARMRSWGYQGDNNVYSVMTVPLIAVSGSLAVFSKRWWQHALGWGLVLLQAHQIMLLESRGCMLGALALVGTFIWLVPKTSLKVSYIVAAGLLVAALAGPPVVKEFSSSFAGEEELDSSAESRYKLWQAGAAITADYPLLGVGPFAGQNLVPKYYPGGLNAGKKGLHNLFFEISTGCGLPATLAYLGFFAIPIYFCYRKINRYRKEPLPNWAACSCLAVVAGLVGYWASSMFSSGALMESSYALAAVGIATLAVLEKESTATQMPLENHAN